MIHNKTNIYLIKYVNLTTLYCLEIDLVTNETNNNKSVDNSSYIYEINHSKLQIVFSYLYFKLFDYELNSNWLVFTIYSTGDEL